MKILVFTEGTVLMHPSAQSLTREERVEQSKKRDRSVYDYKNHIPIGYAVEKIKKWNGQGAEIFYLTSRTKPEEVTAIQNVLQKYGFPDAQNLLFRRDEEAYQDVVEGLMPDVIVEDDCESIGGEVEMTYPHIRADLKMSIKSIVVKEFGGIDHLPDDIHLL